MFLSNKTPKINFANNAVLKDFNKRCLFKKYELKKKVLNALIQDTTLSGSLKQYCVNKLNAIPRNASKTRIRNRCILSGRSRAVYKKFKISRIKFRELASSGQILSVTHFTR